MLPRTYILCAAWAGLTAQANLARTEPGWRVHELATGHDAMITAPHLRAELLLEIGTELDQQPDVVKEPAQGYARR